MKKYILLLLILSVFSEVYSQQQPAIPISTYGIWDRGGYFLKKPTDTRYNYFRGVQIESNWSDIQPTNSAINWSTLDANLQTCNTYNKCVYINILVGPNCPSWLYTAGVPKVLTDQTTQFNGQFPYYLNATYKTYYFNLISEFGKHIRSLSPALRSRVAFIQVMTGCTGDECAYKGNPLDTQYNITDANWLQFRLTAFSKFKSAFHDGDQSTVIPMLFNNIDPDNGQPVEWKWVSDSIGSDFGFKGSAYGRGHHLTGELPFKNTWNPYQLNPKGMVLFSRAEMDQSCTKTMYNLNPKIGFYWGILSGLNTGLSVHDQSANATDLALADPEIMSSILFFNKYAGQIFPASATAAYSVFHEGLNSDNIQKFPEKDYTNCAMSNVTRYQKICLAYQAQGAKIDDALAVVQGQVYQRDKQTGYNDSGWDIQEGNYERWIEQIKADSTSIGRYRLRGPLTVNSSKYDRFARSFQSSKKGNTMYFKFHDEMFSPTNQPKSLKFSITYLDSTANSTWEFRYKDKSGVIHAPVQITQLGDKQWKTVTTTITDMDVSKSGVLGSDFTLVNTDNIDDIFNGIEVDIERTITGVVTEIVTPGIFFPNPVKSDLRWNMNTNFDQIRIYSVSGILLLQSSNVQTGSLDLSHLQRGMYFCQFTNGNQVIQTGKIIKD
ncbi:MAG: T9SS type A sorting domain-containing protein [Paludibacter sp.]